MQRDPHIHREIHNLVQGTDEWHAFRFRHHGASEAAAMLGLSKQVSRSELVRMKATGLAKEFSDWVQANILDYGHEVEAMARPLAERIIGEDLYPATLSLGSESASCDGLTMDEAKGWEHKQWNEELAASVRAGVLPNTHMPQVQQELMVTGAEKWMFMVSDGTEANVAWMWVHPNAAWFDRIRAGWEQFDIDVANYKQVDIPEKPVAEPIAALPALVVQTEGKVVSSNLVAYKVAAERFLAGIKTELEDDEDFANAENTVKFCGEAEGKLELAKSAALAQTATIDEVLRTVDHIKEQFRAKRLQLEKLVKTRKEQIKETILNEGRREYADHVAALETEIAPIRLQLQMPDFAGAMKNKRTLASLNDAVSTTLANAKISANQAAADIRVKLTWFDANAGQHRALFMDLQQIIGKALDDFQLVVNTRIERYQADQRAKADALRKQIEEQERAKAEAAAAERLAAERKADADRLAAEQVRVAAETKRQLDEQAASIAAERQAAERAAALAEQGRLTDLADAQTPSEELPTANSLPGSAELSPSAADLLAQEGAANFARAHTPPSLKLGDINERLGFTVNAAFLESLGFTPAATDKSAKLYHERDFNSMCAALCRHISAAQAQYAA